MHVVGDKAFLDNPQPSGQRAFSSGPLRDACAEFWQGIERPACSLCLDDEIGRRLLMRGTGVVAGWFDRDEADMMLIEGRRVVRRKDSTGAIGPSTLGGEKLSSE
ncbi:hypothetical protein ColLi_12251 [Colletotrichum liriopes]|uniref:Uncharacterized protein n=1 Tax=Colletotrichum liriopes TaxID=708192 RepID=A0AA37LZG3_9PEZI|nr:hypothetical protein ColLi_12251 [Colletotrichum liriopes]